MGLSEGLPGFIFAGLALTGSPGPANFGLAAAGAAFGLRRSLVLSAGIIVGVLAVMLLTATGVTGVILAQPALGPAIRILAVAYMLWLAWAIATAPPLTAGREAGRPPSFGAGLFLGVGNPKSYAAMSALYSGFALAEHAELDIALKLTVLLIMLCGVAVAWLLLGAVLTRWFRDPATSRAINIAFAVLLVVSVAFAFLH
jgi:threonine/homoserine/homoserine lactone efflux protein